MKQSKKLTRVQRQFLLDHGIKQERVTNIRYLYETKSEIFFLEKGGEKESELMFSK